AGGGMVPPPALAALARIGGMGLEAGDATLVLDRLLGAGMTQAVVAQVDWSAFKPIYEARRTRPLLEHLETRRGHTNGESLAGRHGAYHQVMQTPADQRQAILQTYLQAQVAKVLKLDPGQPVDSERPLKDLGLDSLVALELKNRIQIDLGVALPIVTFFENPDITQLAAHLHNQLAATSPPSTAGGGRKAATALSRSSLVEIRPVRLRPPFVSVAGGLGIPFYFTELALHLGQDQPFYG